MARVARRIAQLAGVGSGIRALLCALGLLMLGSLLLAVFGPEGRANALASAVSGIASTAAAVAAVWLGRAALIRTDLQTAEAQRATELSRYPLIVPRHEPIGAPDDGGRPTQHPPAEARYVLRPADAGGFAFVEIGPDEYLLPLENVGEGPGLRVRGVVHRGDGGSGPLHGLDALGAGRTAFAVSKIGKRESDTPDAIWAQSDGHHGGFAQKSVFALQLDYEDVFGHSRALTAFFYPTGTGYWQVIRGHSADVRA